MLPFNSETHGRGFKSSDVTPPKSIPYRVSSKGEQPIFTTSYDKPENKPILVKEPHVKVFDLSNPDHVKEYEDIFNGRSQGKVLIEIDEKNWCPEKSTYIALVRWYNMYLENPNPKDREIVYANK